ncbi:MAG: hypothetical protein ACJ780_18845 [Solirubrobacteraceae bacterium]
MGVVLTVSVVLVVVSVVDVDVVVLVVLVVVVLGATMVVVGTVEAGGVVAGLQLGWQGRGTGGAGVDVVGGGGGGVVGVVVDEGVDAEVVFRVVEVVLEVEEVKRASWAAITAAVRRAWALPRARRKFVDDDGNGLAARPAPPKWAGSRV